jgi:hypothetical protein
MFSKDLFGWLAVALCLAGYVPYVWTIFCGRTRPHLVSWLLWGVLNGILFSGQLIGGGGAGAWVTGTCAAISLAVAALAVTHGERTITGSDWLTVAAAGAALPVWYFTCNPLWALVIISAIDTLAWLPTFRKTYAKPLEESASAFALFALAWASGLLGLAHYDAMSVLPPLCGLLEESTFLAMLLWRRRVMLALAGRSSNGNRLLSAPAG